MSGEITAADLDHFERTLEALALECKITDEHMFNMLAIHGACIAAAVDKEREACARVIEEGQETFSDTRAGQSRHLTPRAKGNLAGLAYAEAIRARSTATV